MNIQIKSGIGFDVHAFASGRPLILGGVTIPYKLGLAGHSDADVLAHAITDAIAGVALGKDIGNLFPDTDRQYKDADSLELLRRALKQVYALGYVINNIDATIIAQAPKLYPFIPDMKSKLACAMGIDIEDLSIKATTTEHLGFVGRQEGIAVLVVATLLREKQRRLDERD